MVPRRILSSLIALTALYAAACSEGTLAGRTSHKASSDDGEDDATEGKDIQADDENEDAALPAEVTGAFLTCGEAPEFAPLDTTSAPRGCAFAKDGTKVDVVVEDAKVIAETDADKIPAETETAPATSAWHFYFALPAEAKDTLRSLVVNVTVGNQTLRIRKVTTTGVGQWTISSGVGEGSSAIDPTQPANDDAIAEIATGLPVAAAFQHTLFVTSRGFSPGKDDGSHFNSFGAASARCKEVATANTSIAKAAPNWIALVSDGTPLADRGSFLVGNIVDMKGRKLYNYGDAFGKLLAPVSYDETGATVADNTWVWTGSTSGAGKAKNCGDWTLGSSEESMVGDPKSRSKWLESSTKTCVEKGNVSAYRLYCMGVP